MIAWMTKEKRPHRTCSLVWIHYSTSIVKILNMYIPRNFAITHILFIKATFSMQEVIELAMLHAKQMHCMGAQYEYVNIEGTNLQLQI